MVITRKSYMEVGAIGYLFSDWSRYCLTAKTMQKFISDSFLIHPIADLTHPTNKFDLPTFYETLITLFMLKAPLVSTKQILTVVKSEKKKRARVRFTLVSSSSSNNNTSPATITITTDTTDDSVFYAPKLAATKSRKRGRGVSLA